MKTTARILLCFWVALFSTHVLAVEPKDISWQTLAPPAAKIENPFQHLTAEQLDGLRQILRSEAKAEQSNDPEARTKAMGLRKQLNESGLDVDRLFAARLAIMEQRVAAASGVNEALIGTTVRLPGYVLPLEFENGKAIEFLLVPTVGACIHTPPPPANQVVHVLYPAGIEVNRLFAPVIISGTMAGQSSVQTVGYADGQAPVSVSYAMRPDRVDLYVER